MAPKKSKIDTLTEQIEQIHTPAAFNAADWIKNGGVQLPSADVDIFTDVHTGYLMIQVDREIAALQEIAEKSAADPYRTIGDDDGTEERLLVLRARREELALEMYKSRLVFSLKGISPETNSLLEDRVLEAHKGDEDPAVGNQQIGIERLVLMLKKITRFPETPDEQVDNGPWAADTIKAIYEGLPLDQQASLANEVNLLTIGVRLSDQRGAADFLS